MVTQGLADGLDEYDIVASARIVGKDLCLIEGLVEANIVIVEISRLIDLLTNSQVTRLQPTTNNNKIIGISGGSGAGKTTLANALLKHYAGKALVISYDRYYKRMPCGNYDVPEALDTELSLKHLHLLKSGKAVEISIYRINGKRTNAVEWVEPKPIIIVEGIFALHPPELLELYHRKVFVDVPSDSVRFHRRLVRDIRERGDTKASVSKVWAENVLPTHQRLIEPQMARADLVVSGHCVAKR